MGRHTKSGRFCAAIFALCLLLRFIEYFLVETDRTVVGENVLHKACGIVILAAAMKMTRLKWSDIGFRKNGAVSGVLKGLLLGCACFAVSYAAEFAILAAQEIPAHFELYISGFSLVGEGIRNTGAVFFVLCVLLNIINVWMEEGVFRGLFIHALSDTRPFMRANLISAALFGVWHIVMPIKSCVDGDMTPVSAVLMSVGYIILAGIMGIKWGLLCRVTGSLWVGLGDHLLNNTVATNMLHVVSQNGADELQIVRILIAQLISFALVLIIYRRGRKKAAV